ncbi:MAG: ABC transporter permease [Anaerolineaceae bacterium]
MTAINNKVSQKGYRFSIGQLLAKNYLVFVIIILVILGASLSGSFFKIRNLQTIMVNITIYAFLAIGQAITMMVGELNLTLGVHMAFGPIVSMTVAELIYKAQGKVLITGGMFATEGWGYVVVGTFLTGIVLGFLIWFIRVKFKIASIITTLGLQFFMLGLCYLLKPYSLLLTGTPGLKVLGQTFVWIFPVGFLILIVFATVLSFCLRNTKFGQRVYATGNNEKAATYLGVKTDLWKLVAFQISMFCASMAGLMSTSRVESIDPLQGNGLQFYAIAIAVISGVRTNGESGTVEKVLLGSVAVYLLINILNLLATPLWYKTTIIGALILIAAIQLSASARKGIDLS